MLFILAVDLLHPMIELASEQVMPAPIGSQELHLCISLCADDAAIFINPACLNWTPSVTSSALLDRLLDWLQCYKKAPFYAFQDSSSFPCSYRGRRNSPKHIFSLSLTKPGQDYLAGKAGWLWSTRFSHQFQDTRSWFFSSPNGPKSSLVGSAVPSSGWCVTMQVVANVMYLGNAACTPQFGWT
jgi:hypothetical protein